MSESSIKIQLLGSLTLEKNGIQINDSDNRSKKLWLLMSYLFLNHNQKISQEKLISVMWPNDTLGSNPTNALKTLFHRTRTILDTLGDGVGRELLQCKKGEFFLNPKTDLTFDFEEFESSVLLAKSLDNLEDRFQAYYKAFELYNGDLLSKFSSESWIIPIATYYHNMYLDVVYSLLTLCDEQQDYRTAISICTRANTIEQYDEHIYLHLMKNLLAISEYQEVVNTYQFLSDMLTSNFGVKPSDNVRALYREASQNLQTFIMDISEIEKRLVEPSSGKREALYCDFDFFCEIYHALSRGVERTGSAMHLATITLTDMNDNPLSKRSLTVARDNLKNLMCQTLRQGDILSLITPCQFVLILPNTNIEGAESVLARIKKNFYKQYPHSMAKLSFHVKPILSPFSPFT